MKRLILSMMITMGTPLLGNGHLPIGKIQGAEHASPYVGEEVSTEGIVTRVYRNGFILESAQPDEDVATSEAIYVYQEDTSVSVGNRLRITGTVEEFTPGGEDSHNLSLTQIRLQELRQIRSHSSLPKPVVLNYLLASFPTNIKSPGSRFDPSMNALDFWESIEHMRVVILDPSVIGPKNKFGEVALRVPEGRAQVVTPQGGIKLESYQTNAPRILAILDRDNPYTYNTGDKIEGTVHGNVTYSFGNYKVGISKPLKTPRPATQLNQSLADAAQSDFRLATFNVENLYTELPTTKFKQLATIITDSLHSPHIVALQEIHDNSGPNNDETVDASEVLTQLTAAIRQAGGPDYQFLQLNPENNADGGWPGANIRNAFLHTKDLSLGKSYRLEDSVFDIQEDKDFSGTRKPLVAFFKHQDETFIFVNCHLRSKGGDTSPFGALQPAMRFSEIQRSAQMQAIRAHVDQLKIDYPEANLVVLGDMNDFEFSPVLKLLTEDDGLVNLIDALPLNQRYTYIFQGYSQVLDHILVSPDLATRLDVQILNLNSNLSESLRSSDHDPILAWLK